MAFVPFWFILIAVLWTGFFVLEGFDMGVGMLHSLVGKDEAGKRTAMNTIGPLWDGNEVWLIVAAAAIFAAFPGWYATWLSGFYLAFVLLLVALILRGVAFEFRGKNPTSRWRNTWSWLLSIGSLLVPFLLGLALGDLLHGVPIGANHEYTGNFGNLFQPYAIYTGITLVFICVLHGAIFIALKTTGDVRYRAGRLARRVAPVTGLVVFAFVGWTHVTAGGGGFLNPVELLIAILVVAAWALLGAHREGWAFAATCAVIGLCIITIFVDLYPKVMVSSTNPAYSLTVHNSASPPYTLKIMTVVALVFLPIVLGYQAWTYYVFRKRISDKSYRSPAPTSVRPAVSATVAAASRSGEPAGGASLSPRRPSRPKRHGFGLWRGRRG